MLTPLKLTLRNYCQHRHLEVNLEDSLHLIIGANGRGKSNILNALNYVITGASSPGAKSLQDDILDGAESATVSLDFTGYEGIVGNITRTIRRNGADYACLKIDGKEPIEGAEKCRVRLEELVGNDLKTVMRTVIVGQHDIRELLFSETPSKRLEQIQKLLLGNIFTEAYESIQTEKSKLYLDENVEAATQADKKTLREQEKYAQKLAADIAKNERTLNSTKLQKLREKADRVNKRNALQAEWLNLREAERTQNSELQNLQATLKEMGKPQEPGDLAEKITKMRTLQQAWINFKEYEKSLTNAIANAEALQKLQKELTKQVEENTAARKQLEEIEYAEGYYKDLEKITELGKESEELNLRIAKLRQAQNACKEKQEKLKAISADARGSANVLRVFLAEGENTQTTCPICGTILLPERITELKVRASELSQKSREYEEQLNTLEVNFTNYYKELAQYSARISIISDSLTTLSQKIGEMAIPAIAKQELPDIKKKVQDTLKRTTGITDELARVTGRITETQAILTRLRSNPVTKPKEEYSNELCEEMEQKLKTIQEAESQRNKCTTSINVLNGSLKVIREHIIKLEEAAKTENLPALSESVKYEISEEDRSYLETAKNQETQVSQLKTRYESTNILIRDLQTRIKNAEDAVLGVQSTKAYAGYLNNIGKVLKSLPKILLQRQMAELCKKMQEIISSFHFYQPFGVMVNEKLELLLKYPNKTIRPIKKASGGEQIILSLAFRLAAHSKFSSLDWIAIDEPTNHLNDDNTKILRQVIEHLKDNLSSYGIKKLIIATHSSILANTEAHIINI